VSFSCLDKDMTCVFWKMLFIDAYWYKDGGQDYITVSVMLDEEVCHMSEKNGHLTHMYDYISLGLMGLNRGEVYVWEVICDPINILLILSALQ